MHNAHTHKHARARIVLIEYRNNGCRHHIIRMLQLMRCNVIVSTANFEHSMQPKWVGDRITIPIVKFQSHNGFLLCSFPRSQPNHSNQFN